MKISAKFINESCFIELLPENSWEKRLIGAVAGGTGMMVSEVEYKPEGHFSYQNAEVVRVVLTSTKRPED